MLSLHGGQCIIIKTHYDETEQRAHDSKIVRAKENLKLSLFKYATRTQNRPTLGVTYFT